MAFGSVSSRKSKGNSACNIRSILYCVFCDLHLLDEESLLNAINTLIGTLNHSQPVAVQ